MSLRNAKVICGIEENLNCSKPEKGTTSKIKITYSCLFLVIMSILLSYFFSPPEDLGLSKVDLAMFHFLNFIKA